MKKKKKSLSDFEEQRDRDNISKRRYIDSRGVFKIYYSKDEHSQIKKEFEKTEFSVKDIFEMGLKQLKSKKINEILEPTN